MVPIENNEAEKIRKLLKELQSYGQLVEVLNKVFQKNPSISNRLIAETEGVSLTRRKMELISLLVDEIKELVEDPAEARKLNMPLRIKDYLKFIDLLVLIQKAEQKTWQVYNLRDFSGTSTPDLGPGDEVMLIRNKIKSWFSAQGFIGSVQGDCSQQRIWFSVSFTKKTKNRSKDKARLQRSKYFYIVHYPGEPYFYVSGAKLPQEVGDAVAHSLDASGYIKIPLSGKNLESLRQLRLNREERIGYEFAVPGIERFSVLSKSSKDEYPKLDKLTTEANLEFRGLEDLEDQSSLQGLKINMRLDMRGSDIIGGLAALMEAGVVKGDPVPRWVSQLPTAGRNVFSLVKVPMRDNDMRSIISTASTNINP